MKVVHLVQFFEAGYAGGIQRYVAELAKLQRQMGLDASILTVTLGRGHRNGSGWAGGGIESVPVQARESWAILSRTPIYPAIVGDVRRLDADVVHLHGPSPWFEAALLFARPKPGGLVVTLHNTFPRTTAMQRYLGWFGQRLMARTLKRADAVIAPTLEFLNSFVPPDLARRIGPKLHVLPPGVDHDQFRPLGVPRDENCVLFVAHLRPEKGLHVLVEAMSLLPRLRLEVLCTVSYEAAYVRQVCRDAKKLLGTRVKFVFSPDRKSLIEAYNRASCVVVPSLGLESWNLVLLEAAACGTACVRTELPGLAWATFAVPAPAGEAAETARAIEWTIAHREELGDRAKRAADQYSWERTCRETVAAYAQAGLAT